jgi:hypothetical protein
MNMERPLLKVVRALVSVMLIFQLSACGYFMYPERRGQKPVGRIDPAIAVLDALGLLLFIIPGVIAFAVDITNGTLYFPAGRQHSSASTETGRITMIRINPSEFNETMIREMVENGELVSMVAVTPDGEIVAHQGLKKEHRDSRVADSRQHHGHPSGIFTGECAGHIRLWRCVFTGGSVWTGFPGIGALPLEGDVPAQGGLYIY